MQGVAAAGGSIDMEACFSQLTLDVIGKAVFNYDFDALTASSPLIQASATLLRPCGNYAPALGQHGTVIGSLTVEPIATMAPALAPASLAIFPASQARTGGNHGTAAAAQCMIRRELC